MSSRSRFGFAKLFVRSYDRGHSLQLIRKDVDYEIRETVMSAMALGEAALVGLGFTREEATETATAVRQSDQARLQAQLLEGHMNAGDNLMFQQGPQPAPLTPPKRESQALTDETAHACRGNRRRRTTTRPSENAES